MSLATRCSSCNTVFKVVQDQLKVSKGWVRCGRCDTVFNSLEELFELNGDTIIGGVRQPSQRSAAVKSEVMSAAEQESSAASFLSGSTEEREDGFSRSLFSSFLSGGVKTPAALVKEEDRNEFADAKFDSDLLADEEGPGLGVPKPPAPEPKYTPPQPSENVPAFVRHADAQARWKTPRARMLLLTISVLLTAVLGLQVAHQFRDRLAAQSPAARSFLTQWCDWVGCQLSAYRSIKDFTVENSALTRLPGSGNVFRLSVTLRNRSSLTLALPCVEISVTDTAGQLIARRTLMVADFQPPQDSVGPNSEVPLQLLLKSLNPNVNGYTVEVFYP